MSPARLSADTRALRVICAIGNPECSLHDIIVGQFQAAEAATFERCAEVFEEMAEGQRRALAVLPPIGGSHTETRNARHKGAILALMNVAAAIRKLVEDSR